MFRHYDRIKRGTWMHFPQDKVEDDRVPFVSFYMLC